MLRSRRSSVTEPYFVAIPKEERYQVKFRDLKEMYVQFNSRNGGNPLLARNEIKDLIQTYKSYRFEIFRDFASLLEKFENPIVN